MLGDDLERHCQADTAAANARDIMRSLECFKDARQVRHGDAYALVTHRKDRRVSRVIFVANDRDGDHPAIRTVLECVAQQIVKNALEPRRVPLANQLPLACQLDDVPLRLLLVFAGHQPRQRYQVHAAALQLQRAPQLQAGDIQQLVDHAGHSFDGGFDPRQPLVDGNRAFATLQASGPTQQLRLAADRREWALQIVRHRGEEAVPQLDGLARRAVQARVVDGQRTAAREVLGEQKIGLTVTSA